MADDKQEQGPLGAQGSLSIDENKVYLVRKKPDGYYKIFVDGREEKFDPEKET
jgi:hypothetical protein